MSLERYFNDGQPPILIVDDEEDNVARLTNILNKCRGNMQKWGFKLPCFYDYISSPEDAIDRMREVQEAGKRYKAIITDFNLGSINGKDFLRIVFDKSIYALSGQREDMEIDVDELISGVSLIPESARSSFIAYNHRHGVSLRIA